MSHRVTKQVTTSPVLKPIVKVLKANTGSRRAVEVFDDFVAMLALAMRNATQPRSFDESAWEAREAEYLRRAGHYDSAQMQRFSEAAALLTNAMEAEPSDLLGRLYMELGAGDAGLGQFFTPSSVAQLMAQLHVPTLREQVDRLGFARVNDPACGGGVMLIEMVRAMADAGLDYQRHLHITADDLDSTAVHMTYIQLSLLHVPALVRHMNSLSMQVFDVWPTLAHRLGGWDLRLAAAA